ncbi:unnamed protein product, partial [Phaeothamnion confervicola]
MITASSSSPSGSSYFVRCWRRRHLRVPWSATSGRTPHPARSHQPQTAAYRDENLTEGGQRSSSGLTDRGRRKQPPMRSCPPACAPKRSAADNVVEFGINDYWRGVVDRHLEAVELEVGGDYGLAPLLVVVRLQSLPHDEALHLLVVRKLVEHRTRRLVSLHTQLKVIPQLALVARKSGVIRLCLSNGGCVRGFLRKSRRVRNERRNVDLDELFCLKFNQAVVIQRAHFS